jgi:hypothetical protein
VRANAQEFLLRHRYGSRFSVLPVHVQDLAVLKLTDWAVKTFGSLDTPFDEQRSFELDVFEF